MSLEQICGKNPWQRRRGRSSWIWKLKKKRERWKFGEFLKECVGKWSNRRSRKLRSRTVFIEWRTERGRGVNWDEGGKVRLLTQTSKNEFVWASRDGPTRYSRTRGGISFKWTKISLFFFFLFCSFFLTHPVSGLIFGLIFAPLD